MKVVIEDMRTHLFARGADRHLDVEMDDVPRVGESVSINADDSGFTVKTVLWVLQPEPYVLVRGW
jgi:hypothetical protein